MLQWTDSNCPPAFRFLDADVRSTALIEANAFLEAGQHPIRALSNGIAKALSPPMVGPLYHVWTLGDGWTLTAVGDADDIGGVFPTLDAALHRGCSLAREGKSACYVFGLEGALLECFEFFGGDSGAQGLDVVPVADGGWAVRDRSSTPLFEHHATKAAALKRGRTLAKEASALLHVYYQSGDHQDTTSYA